MGLFNSILDNFKSGEFSISRGKKLKTVSKEFKEAFGLTLVFYKGKQIADGDLTLAALDSKTTKDATKAGQDLKIKASMKVGDVEKLIDHTFGTTVQIKDPSGKVLVDNNSTLGDALRSYK